MNLPTMTPELRADMMEGIEDFITDMQADFPNTPTDQVLGAIVLTFGTVIELLPSNFSDAVWSAAEHTLTELFGPPASAED